MATVRSFLAIEKSLASRLQKSWGQLASDIQKKVEAAVAAKDYEKAYRIANNIDVSPVIKENLPYIRYSTYAALFFGASRLTKKAKDTIIKNGEWDATIEQATKLLRRSLEANVRDQIQDSLVREIQAIEESEKAEQLALKYDPSQPRDEYGQWVRTLASGPRKGRTKMFHGTASAFIESILEKGLIVNPENRQYPPMFYDGVRGQAVYTTSKFHNALEFAGTASANLQFRGHKNVTPVIIEARIPNSILDVAPGDAYVPHTSLLKEVKPEWITAIHIYEGDKPEGKYSDTNPNPVQWSRHDVREFAKKEDTTTIYLVVFVPTQEAVEKWERLAPKNGQFLQTIANLLGVSTEAKNRKFPVEEAVAKDEDFSGEPLYVHRKLENWQDLSTWAKQQGFPTNLAEKMHVTIAYSKALVNWYKLMPEVHNLVVRGGRREVKPLGDGGAVVLSFESPELEDRWAYYKSKGASWDYDGYTPHITITWDLPEGFDLKSIAPYAGDLVFGQEWWERLDEDWKDNVVEKAERIAHKFVSFSRTGDSMLQLISTLHTSRVSALGFVAEAEVLGVKEYAISEQLDTRICPICFEMHGKRFAVSDARDTLDTIFAAESPDDLATIQPWPRQDQESVSRFKRLDADQLVENNWHIPPFHPGCRGILVHVKDVPQISQLPSTQAAYEDDTDFKQTAEDFAAYGVKATLDDIGAWNTWVGMPVKDYLASITGKNPFEILRMVDKTGVQTMSFQMFKGDVPRLSIATVMDGGIVEMQLLVNEPTILLTAVPERVTKKMLTRWVDLWKGMGVSYYQLETPLTNVMEDALQLIAREQGISSR